MQKLSGFRYLPEKVFGNPGLITRYELYVSADNKEWKLADKSEFSNIKNNPLWQTKKFATKKARYIRLLSLNNGEDKNNSGYAKVDLTAGGG